MLLPLPEPAFPLHYVSRVLPLGAVLPVDPPGKRGSSELEFTLICCHAPSEQRHIVDGALLESTAYRDRGFLNNWECT